MARRVPRDRDPRQLHAIGDRLALHVGERNAGNRHRIRTGRRLDVAEPFLDEAPRRGRVEVAGDDQARIRRRVIPLEELDRVVIAGRGEILHVADDRPVVGMPFRIEHLGKQQIRRAVRPVLVALTALVLDDVPLGVDGLRRHRLEQVAHAVGLEEQRELERVGGHVDPVVRAVVARRSVVVAAGAFEPRVEFARLDVARSHEHQVLEQVREPGPSRPLVRRADVVPHVDADERDAVVLVEDDAEAVRQRELGDRAPAAWSARRAMTPSASSRRAHRAARFIRRFYSRTMAACQTPRRSLPSSWEASPTGRRCVRPPRS